MRKPRKTSALEWNSRNGRRHREMVADKAYYSGAVVERANLGPCLFSFVSAVDAQIEYSCLHDIFATMRGSFLQLRDNTDDA